MRRTPHYMLTDPDEIKRLVRENPWSTIVSYTATGLVASHYPVLLEEDAEGISLVSHVGRPDERLHELGEHEVMVIIQGPHGYISPGWYDNDDVIPTWNHVTAHLWGTPELLSDDENFEVLARLVDHFEERMPEPRSLSLDEEGSRQVATGTVGMRLKVTRFDARAKLSQNRDEHVRERIATELESGDHYAQPALAQEMRRVRS